MFFQSIENGAKSLYNGASSTFRGDEKIKFNKILKIKSFKKARKKSQEIFKMLTLFKA